VSYPGASRYVGIAFYQGAGIEVVIGHGFVPRCSWIMSLREGPAAGARIVRTSSRVTPGMIFRRRVALR
jgi:hypothetical protein